MDLLYVGLCFGFYLLAIALVAGCAKLGGPQPSSGEKP